MSFGTFTTNSKTFNPAGDGRYMRDTVAFGDPADYFTLKGGSLTKDRKNIVGAINRVIEKDIEINGQITRRALSVQTIITAPTTGFTTADIDGALEDTTSFATESTLNVLMAGGN